MTERFDSNVSFRREPVDDLETGLGTGLSFSRSSPRSVLSLSGQGTARFYRDATGLNRLTWSAGGAWRRELSPYSQLRISERFLSTYTGDFGPLADEGVLLERSSARRNRAGVEYGRQLNPRTDLKLSARHDWASFESRELADGTRVRLAAAVGRRVSSATSIGGSYEFEISRRAGATAYIHTPGAVWQRSIGASVTLSARAGVSILVRDEGTSTHAGGDFTFRHRSRRSEVVASYERRVSQAFGLGTERLADIVRLGYTHDLTPWLDARVGGVVAWNSLPGDPSSRRQARALNAGLATRIAAWLSLRTEYTYRWRESAVDGPGTSRHQVLFGLAYAHGWR